MTTLLPKKPRIAFYTHDTFGLGHIRRCLHMIRELSKQLKEASILLITGSPALHFLKDLPHNMDIVKIPTIVKTGAKGSLPPHLHLGLPELIEIRSRVIQETLLSFQPDVFIVDNFPLGAQSELLPVLKSLHPTPTSTILGLRDILDGGDVVRKEWKKKGVYDVIDRYYDKVLIYGIQDVFNSIQEYAVPESLAHKIHFCGYLTAIDTPAETTTAIKERYGIQGHLLLATGGGGGDAYPLLSSLIEASHYLSNVHTLIFTGPMMGEEDALHLKAAAAKGKQIIIEEFVPDLRPYLQASDLLVSMCGYNIAAEIVYHRVNAIVAPRTWRFGEHANRQESREEKEQILRAEFLAKFGAIELLKPENLNPKALAEKISCAINLKKSHQLPSTFHLNGLQNAVNHIRELIPL